MTSLVYEAESLHIGPLCGDIRRQVSRLSEKIGVWLTMLTRHSRLIFCRVTGGSREIAKHRPLKQKVI